MMSKSKKNRGWNPTANSPQNSMPNHEKDSPERSLKAPQILPNGLRNQLGGWGGQIDIESMPKSRKRLPKWLPHWLPEWNQMEWKSPQSPRGRKWAWNKTKIKQLSSKSTIKNSKRMVNMQTNLLATVSKMPSRKTRHKTKHMAKY